VTIGARSQEQLRDNLGAAELRLTTEEAQRLEAVSDRPLPYPYWHQRKYNAERSQRHG
jgi:aryl-alcohol dehydrogenase-like predicted oxidoreductase